MPKSPIPDSIPVLPSHGSSGGGTTTTTTTTTDAARPNPRMMMIPPPSTSQHNRIAAPTFIPTMRDLTSYNDDAVYSDDSFISHTGGGGIGTMGISGMRQPLSPKPSNVSSVGTGTHLSPTTSSQQQQRPTTILRVNDILKINPLESEAETLIMKAIERQDMIHQYQQQQQQQQQQRSRANTMTNETSSLLSNCVPNESIGIFTTSNTTTGGGTTTMSPVDGGGGGARKTTTFDTTSSFENHNNTIISPSSTSFEQQHHWSGSTNRPPRPPPTTTAATAAIPPQQQQISKPIFSRHQTTEDTLAALTMAMEGFQDHRSSSSTNTQNQHKDDGLETNIHVQSAAEAFAQNANMVFFHNHRKQQQHHHPPPSPPRQNSNNQPQQQPAVVGDNIPPVSDTSCSPSTSGGDNAPTNTKTTTTTTKTRLLSPHWTAVKNLVATSTIAELNGIDVSNGDDAKSNNNYNSSTEQEFVAVPHHDVEIGDHTHDIPFDESAGGGRNGDANDDDNNNQVPPTTSSSIRMNSSRTNGSSNNNKNNLLFQALSKGAVQDLQLFIRQRRRSIALYTRLLVILVLPALTASCFLFYFFDNTPTGIVDMELYRYNGTMVNGTTINGTLINVDGKPIGENDASVSWWILFVCVRQALTFSVAQFLQVLIIDFLCLNTRFFTTLVGNLVTLLIAQSKGWPFIVFIWGLLNFAVLHGDSRFASSWLYWQDYIDVFNEANPSGRVTSNVWNTRILSIMVCVGITVAMKRLWLGLFLGKKTYVNYAEELTNVVKKALLLCEVATLAREFYYNDSNGGGTMRRMSQFGMSKEALSVILHKSIPSSVDNEDIDATERQALVEDVEDLYNGGLIINSRQGDLLRGHLDQSQRTRLIELLGAWEEPEAEGDTHENVTISSILQFRNSLTLLDSDFMFGIAWGDVTTRAKMVINSQEVYHRLLLPTPDSGILKFEILARVAMGYDGKTLNHEKLEALIRLLRPDRDGNLSLLDFVKSTDGVYKEMKLLRASIKNSEYIDRAFEKAFNVAFYTVMTCIILSRIGIDPIALFLSLSGLILAFAFMIGSAASKMFEGFLFILVRRPYNIGDRIHISSVEADTDPTGSAGWIVKDVTLFNTTLIYGATGERATVANGSLAASRVINMARSPKATVSIDLKFPTDSPFERVKVFEQSLRDFIKARPREWANFNGFRAGTIYSDLGYIEYTVSLSHREAWQNIIAIINSKAEVAAFCLELSKQLELPVQTPMLPVTLTLARDSVNKSMELDSEAGKFIRSFGGTGNVPEVDVGEE